ncbi:MAG: MFS transporter [Pseudomonas sp.]|uniref:MFS transporter n=1 Tax=Pseudomonas sp. TaxID=306 RepID=UPI003396346F
MELRLGLAQLIGWGVTFYLPGVFGPAIATAMGWTPVWVYAGLSLAMLVMGLVSPLTGRLVGRHGGRRVMVAGMLLSALGCVLLAVSQGALSYYGAWLVLGVGMRGSLYDAAFATLVGLQGTAAGPAMQRITLFGGLASTLFWPLGELWMALLGWRPALGLYAALALAAGLLLLGLPKAFAVAVSAVPVARSPWSRAARLYALLMVLLGFLAAGVTAHLPALLAGQGLPVVIAALWGIGQVSGRVLDLLLGRRLSPLGLTRVIGIALPLCFALGLCSGGSILLATLWVFGYGAVNGLATRVRASVPLLLFAPDQYAARTGPLLAPGFVMAALAPAAYAALRQDYGDPASLLLSLLLAVLVCGAALALRRELLARPPFDVR